MKSVMRSYHNFIALISSDDIQATNVEPCVLSESRQLNRGTNVRNLANWNLSPEFMIDDRQHSETQSPCTVRVGYQRCKKR